MMTFDQRLTRLHRKHRRMLGGASYRIAPDGLIVAGPRRGAVLPRFPLRELGILLAFALGFKALLFAALGPSTYEARLDVLAAGSLAEQAGAWAMRPDPLTRALAGLVPSF